MTSSTGGSATELSATDACAIRRAVPVISKPVPPMGTCLSKKDHLQWCGTSLKLTCQIRPLGF